MVDAALNIAAEQVIEHSANGVLLQRDGNRGPTAAPQNLYQSSELDEFGRDDSWVAVAVQTDEQWRALRTALGDPGWSTDPALDAAVGRHAAHDLLDEHLGAWCRTRTGDEIVEKLWGAGVPVAKVMQPHRQTELPQLRHRRFFEHVGHPVNNAAAHSTLPVTLANGPAAFHRVSAPLLGEHNETVLSALGLSDEEIATLADDGVIGTEPGKGGRRNAIR